MKGHTEIERKYLLSYLPKSVLDSPHAEIAQGYISGQNDSSEIRLREMAGLYYLTVKSHGGLIREEREIQLTSEQFTALWSLTEHRRIEKTRYFVQDEGPLIEVDVYKTALSGLIVAEVEYTSVEQCLGFVPPEWFGEEITEDDRYKNRSLAFNGPP